MDPRPPKRRAADWGRPLYFQRKSRRLSQTELAALLGVTPRAVSKAETTQPSAIAYKKYLWLAQWWQVPIQQLRPDLVASLGE